MHSNYKKIDGSEWIYGQEAIYDVLNNFDFNNCDDTIYNNIDGQNFSDIKTLISLAYQKHSLNDEVLYYLDFVGYNKEVDIIKRVRNR